jgi:hypothetical protein
MTKEEQFPVHETVKVLKGVTISKSINWWSAALMVESYGRKQLALYLWRKDANGKWKRKEKFIILPSKDNWEKMKKIIDDTFFSM